MVALLLCHACGSRTDPWSLGGLFPPDPTGLGGAAGAGTGGIVGTGAGGIGTAGVGGVGGGGGGAGVGGAGTGAGGTGTGGGGGAAGAGTGGTGAGGSSTGTGGTGAGGSGTGTGGAGAGGVGAGGAGGRGGAVPDGGSSCFEPRWFGNARDLYFLVDRSASMGTVDPPSGPTETRWARVQAALGRAPVATIDGTRSGIGFFPLLTPDAGGPSCAATDYAIPNVTIQITSQKATPILSDAMTAQTLGGEAPTGPALEGALDYARRWWMSNTSPTEGPQVPPSVVLMTDGPPTACGSTVASAAAIAAAAFRATPRIRTYVVALGSDGSALEPIALAGGTYHVYDARRSVDDVIERIVRSRVVCDMTFSYLDAAEVPRLQVRISSSGTSPLRVLPQVANAESCGADGGWFLERPLQPTIAMVCPSTCADLIDEPAGNIVTEVRCSRTTDAARLR